MATHSFTLPTSAWRRASAEWNLSDSVVYDLPSNVMGPNSGKARVQVVQAASDATNVGKIDVRLRSGHWPFLTDQNHTSYEIVVTATLRSTQHVGRFTPVSGSTGPWRTYVAVSSPASARTAATALWQALINVPVGDPAPSAASVSFNFDANPPPPPPSGADNLYLGSNKVDKVYLGDTEVDAMYLGSTRIY